MSISGWQTCQYCSDSTRSKPRPANTHSTRADAFKVELLHAWNDAFSDKLPDIEGAVPENMNAIWTKALARFKHLLLRAFPRQRVYLESQIMTLYAIKNLALDEVLDAVNRMITSCRTVHRSVEGYLTNNWKKGFSDAQVIVGT